MENANDQSQHEQINKSNSCVSFSFDMFNMAQYGKKTKNGECLCVLGYVQHENFSVSAKTCYSFN